MSGLAAHARELPLDAVMHGIQQYVRLANTGGDGKWTSPMRKFARTVPLETLLQMDMELVSDNEAKQVYMRD